MQDSANYNINDPQGDEGGMIVLLLLLSAFLWLIVTCSGCSSPREAYRGTERTEIRQDTMRRTSDTDRWRHVIDSELRHDSTFVSRTQKGDTVHEVRKEFHYLTISRTDTMRITRTDTVHDVRTRLITRTDSIVKPVYIERKESTAQKMLMAMGMAFAFVIIFGVSFFLITRKHQA